jgi:hypothetical protein
MGRRGNAFDVRLHAAAHIEQEQQVHRHVFPSKVADLLRMALLAQHKIVSVQASDGAVVVVHYLHIYADKRNLAAKDKAGWLVV